MNICEVFNLNIAKSYDLNALEITEQNKGIKYVSRTAKNQGVTAYVVDSGLIKQPGHSISVPLVGASTMFASYQPTPYVASQNIAVLTPKQEMTTLLMLYYAFIIQLSAKNYSYGRTGHSRLKELEIPSPEEIPSWVYEMEIPTFDDISEAKTTEKVELPSVNEWKSFKYSEIFNMTRGQGGTATEAKKNPGTNYYIGASDENNGITQYTSLDPTEPANRITVANNGSVGAAFYQSTPFLASSDVTVLSIKERELTPAIAIFLITLIRQEAAKINYGRKWGISRMKESIIYLPVTENGTPNWQLMEDYINSLPYSKYL